MLPSLFVSHGSPMMLVNNSPASRFLQALGGQIERPRAILAASAHWETAHPAVTTAPRATTIHDFHGFPKALYDLRYTPPGAPELSQRVAALLRQAGFQTDLDASRGLDHGAWVPLKLMFPEANIPTVQISVQSGLGPEHHLRLGQALAPLRREDVLVIGSGGFTHNLNAVEWGDPNAEQPEWVTAFAEPMVEALLTGNTDDLLTYRGRMPFARQNHPTDEHILPLFVAMGAGGEKAKVRHLHESAVMGSIRMDAFAFG
jgi:4,5-DOPA dioxygenase extradiol